MCAWLLQLSLQLSQLSLYYVFSSPFHKGKMPCTYTSVLDIAAGKEIAKHQKVIINGIADEIAGLPRPSGASARGHYRYPAAKWRPVVPDGC